MNLTFSYCKDDDYCDTPFTSKVYKRILFHPEKGRLEVSLVLLPEVSGHSDGKFNVMFLAKYPKDAPENDKKYFAKITFLQRQKLLWMFGGHWFQNTENIWRIATHFITFISGYVLYYFTHNCR